MPLYRFTDPIGRNYPGLRDARGAHVGDVEPGNRRELDWPPDGRWVPADGEDDEDDPDPEAAPEPVPEPEPEPEIPAWTLPPGNEDNPGETGTDTEPLEG